MSGILQQNVIDATVSEWRKRLRACMHADRQHFEHLLRVSDETENVVDK